MTASAQQWLHALRFSIAATLAAAVGEAIDLHHLLWIMMTVGFVLQARLGDSLRRSSHRLLGTLAGALLGWGIAELIGPENYLWLLIAVPPILLAIFVLAPTNYAFAVVFITLFVLFTYALIGQPVAEAALDRALDTAIAVIIGISVSFAIMPRRAMGEVRSAVPNHLRRLGGRFRVELTAMRLGRAEFAEPDHLAFADQAQQIAAGLSAAQWEAVPWRESGRQRRACAGLLVALYWRNSVLRGLGRTDPFLAPDEPGAAVLERNLDELGETVDDLCASLAVALETDLLVDAADFDVATARIEAIGGHLMEDLAPLLDAAHQGRLAALIAESFAILKDLRLLGDRLHLVKSA